MKIEEEISKIGFAWIDDETGELGWAFKEDLQDVDPKERPEGCTPVVIEITPTLGWVEKKRQEHEFLGDLQDQINKFSSELTELEKNLRIKNG